MSKKIGQVYYANSIFIDKTDKKSRRKYVVVKDSASNSNVKVAKIRGKNENMKNNGRLYFLDIKKYPLSKDSGVDDYVYSFKVVGNKKTPLKIDDKQVFDSSPIFKLSSHDTHNVLKHTSNKYRTKKRSK